MVVSLSQKQPTAAEKPEQYQLFDTAEYSYRVFVTNMGDGIAVLAWVYSQRESFRVGHAHFVGANSGFGHRGP
jgi:hypothetical protein